MLLDLALQLIGKPTDALKLGRDDQNHYIRVCVCNILLLSLLLALFVHVALTLMVLVNWMLVGRVSRLLEGLRYMASMTITLSLLPRLALLSSEVSEH